MRSFRVPMFFLASLFLTVFALSCGKNQEPPSNIDISNEDGKTQISKRLAKTNEVKSQLNEIIDGLKPASVLLSDITEAAKKEDPTDGINSNHVQNILEIVQKILKEVTEGYVQYLPDGSWMIDRPLKFPGLAPEYLCPHARVYLTGKREGDVEALRLKVSGCQAEIYPVELAFIGIDSNKRISTSFQLDRFSNLFSKDKLIGESCKITTQNKTIEMNCKPIKLLAGKITLFIEPLYFRSDAAGITAQFGLLVRRSENSKFVVRASLDARPGQSTKIDVSTKEE